ncbi:hypothetical protein D3C76_1183930 [compost metagenome]
MINRAFERPEYCLRHREQQRLEKRVATSEFLNNKAKLTVIGTPVLTLLNQYPYIGCIRRPDAVNQPPGDGELTHFQAQVTCPARQVLQQMQGQAVGISVLQIAELEITEGMAQAYALPRLHRAFGQLQ